MPALPRRRPILRRSRIATDRANAPPQTDRPSRSTARPVSRPMPQIAANCHELRIDDHETDTSWRIIYCVDDIAILVLDVFKKKTEATPEAVKRACSDRLMRYRREHEGN